MQRIIRLPFEFRAQRLFPLMKGIFGEHNEVPESVTFDFSMMNFVRPSGIVFLSNMTKFLLRNHCKVFFDNFDAGNECIKFLDDSLFFEQHIGKKLNPGSSPRNTTRPLQEIRNTNSHNWIRGNLIPWLSESSNKPEHDLMELATCISEVFNNIKDHTELEVGSLFAQWYPKTNRLEICIADFGCGIPKNVRKTHPKLQDHDAIQLAFKEGFSSKSTPRNRGIGLHYLSQNVVERLKGKLHVHSGEGAVSFELQNNSLNIIKEYGRGLCPGTMIELEFSTDLIEPTDGEMENIEW